MNFREFRRVVGRILKGISVHVRRRIKNETYIMIGRYTSGVRGFFRRKGVSRSKQAVTVFDDRNRNRFMLILKFLKNLFFNMIDRQLKSIKGTPYGEVKERLETLSSYYEVLQQKPFS